MKFDDIKKFYGAAQKKFDLPTFAALNSDFEIQKISNDTDCFLRSIRKAMMEKLVNSLGFFEMLLNPMNVPRIYMPYVKTMSSEDRTLIEKMYSMCSDLSIASLELELEYNEKSEAALIKRLFKDWQVIKVDFRTILHHIQKPQSEVLRKEKSYFG